MQASFDPDHATPDTKAMVLTPSRLNRMVKDALESGFPLLWIEGEVSNFYRHASGHWYFNLKDESASVRCAMFKSKASQVRDTIDNGQHVLARARLSLYEPRGEFQLLVESLEDAGLGRLQREFERLKRKLEAEGAFDPGRKRALPIHPKRVAVITSAGGAAIHDVLSVLDKRNRMLEVDVLHVPVQGEGAAKAILQQLFSADLSGRYDVLLLTRGGGSMEDLWAFNEEHLVRAVAASNTPVICAVGHEIDFTLCDFAADVRAPTPSAAAALLGPDQTVLHDRILHLQRVMQSKIAETLRLGQQRNDLAYDRLLRAHPRQRLSVQSERLRALRLRLDQALRPALLSRLEHTRRLALRLEGASPLHRLRLKQLASRGVFSRLQVALAQRLSRTQARVSGLGRTLNAVSPLATLDRGYSIAKKHGKVVRDAAELVAGDRLIVQFANGHCEAEVMAANPIASSKPDP